MKTKSTSWIPFLCLILFISASLCTAPAYARTIRVGYYMFAGYQMEDADGNRSGYGYDFLQEMARYTGWDYEYVGYTLGWARLQEMLNNGEIDILTSARKTPEREGKYLFSNGIGTSAGILTVKTGDTRLTMGDYATYNGIRIGMIKDSSINNNFQRFAAARGFTFTPVYYLNADEMNADLQNGSHIDAVCTTNLRHVQNEWILDQFDSANFYAMLNVKNVALQQEINGAIEQMDRYSPGWRTALWNRYYQPDLGNEISFTGPEKAYINELAASGIILTAICQPDNAPFSYFEDGEAKGIIPQIFAEISRRTGIAFQIKETPNNTIYEKTMKELPIDVCMDAYVNYNDVEKSGRRMTIPYLKAPLMQITRKSLNHIPKTAAVTPGIDSLVPYNDLFKGQIPAKTVYPTALDCVNAILDNSADITFLSPYTVQKFISDSDRSHLTLTLLPQGNIAFALAVSNTNDSRLLTILNKAVYSVNANFTDEVVMDYMSKGPEKISITEFFNAHPYAKALVFAIIAALLGAVFFIVNRQRTLRIIRDKNTELNLAVQEATAANEAKSRFLSNISHDMRTPLNGIIGFTNFAIAEEDNEKKQQHLIKVRQSSSILLNLINDTLELSRIESGKLVFDSKAVSFRELVDDVIVVIQSAAAAQKITFETDINIPANTYVKTDRLKTQEIFLNLLSNAVKYTPAGGQVLLTVCQKERTGSISDFHIVVTDDGIGISEDFLPRIYDSFSQENSMEISQTSGTGLGLAIVKHIVDLMHGTIQVKSTQGKGTIFTVDLPLELVSPKEKIPAPVYSKLDTEPLAGKKVLICEDNEINAEIAKTLLEHKKIQTEWAKDGRDGFNRFVHSALYEYDAILMDIHMPVMDGFTATQNIRALDRKDAKTVTIIAMTADAYDEDIQKCLTAGMNAHIAKPIDTEILFTTLSQQLQ